MNSIGYTSPVNFGDIQKQKPWKNWTSQRKFGKKEWLNFEDSKIWTKESFVLIISKKSEFFSGTQEGLLTCLLKGSKWPGRAEFIRDWRLASNLARHLQNFTNQYNLNTLRYFLCCKQLFCFEGCQYLFSTKPPELNVAVQPRWEDEEPKWNDLSSKGHQKVSAVFSPQ